MFYASSFEKLYLNSVLNLNEKVNKLFYIFNQRCLQLTLKLILFLETGFFQNFYISKIVEILSVFQL